MRFVKSTKIALPGSNPIFLFMKKSKDGRMTVFDFMVERRGFEPLTPTLPVWCAPSCANAPIHSHYLMSRRKMQDFFLICILGEALTWNKLLGIAVCLVGLVFVNMK